MRKSYYKEVQYFSNPWFWVFLIVVITISIAPITVELYDSFTLEKNSGESTGSSVKLLIITLVLMIVYSAAIFMFKVMRLETEVADDGIYYRYPPFILKSKVIEKERIEKFEIRTYKPIREYGGWGIRLSSGSAGRAYNVRGKVGLQLYLKDGKKVLFGTQRKDAIKRAVQKMMLEG